MRQTKSRFLNCETYILRVLLCFFLIFLWNSNALFADITAQTLVVDYPGAATGAKINGAAVVTLQAAWTGDTPPYSATFKTGANALGNVTTSSANANFQVSGAALGHGDGKTFEVEILESSVPAAESKTATGDKSVNVDLQAPGITVTLNKTTFSNNAGNNEVIINITSDEDIGKPTVTVTPDTLGVAPTDDATNPTVGRSFRYTMTLTAAQSNNYTVRVDGRDTTQPTANANLGSSQAVFNVSASGPGAGAINAVSPGTPTKANSVTLSGSVGSNTDTTRPVEILEGGAVVANGTINGTTWSANVNSVTEGVHTYTMRGYDLLGNPSAESGPFVVTVDQSNPSTPTVVQPPTPTGAATITISGTGAVDSGTVVSLPVYVGVYDMNGTMVASAPASSDGSFSISNVALADGDNQFYVQAADATVNGGNLSGISNRVNVFKDVTQTTLSSVIISQPPDLASMPLPLPSSTWYGPGTYRVQANFDENMDTTLNPTITMTFGGGSVVSNAAGTWVDPRTFIGSISVPNNGGTSYDGVSELTVAGARDAAGNTMNDFVQASSLSLDATSPTSSFTDNSALYVSSATTSLSMTGVADDAGSGVGYVDIAWQSFSGGAVSSISVPIFNGAHADWSYNWNVSGLGSGRYKVWVYAGDRATPKTNIEPFLTKEYRILLVDRDDPSVSRVSIGNLATDIQDMDASMVPTIASSVTRLVAKFLDNGDAGIDFGNAGFQFTLVNDSTGNSILGNFSNNASDTVFFDFPELTQNGTYTVTVRPIDKAGNLGVVATRSFVLDTTGPSNVGPMPANNTVVNHTYEPIAAGQVWAVIDDPMADFARSSMVVRYNGNQIGETVPSASTTAVVHNLITGGGNVHEDQSDDGRYDMEVTPVDILGNTGTVGRSFFNLDTQAPVITTFAPALNAGAETWVGNSVTQYSVTLSDAPKDIVTHAAALGRTAVPAGDPNWYNGSGSGVNTTVSSFSWDIGVASSSAPAITGNTFTVNKPSADATAFPEGVVDVPCQVVTADNVAFGNPAPNMFTHTHTYRYDFLEPSITGITKPEPGNNKYCKQTLTIEGAAMDQGTSTDIQVVGIELSEDNTSWTSMSVSGLPATQASFTATMDITNRTDGTYSFYLRAIDRGGNVSPSSSGAFVVDRTPPEAPTMVVPLPDQITNKRGQLFKWATTTDADHYLLQVADDPSFNNILNNQINTAYPALVGQVTVMTENAFSLPKDGTYYWRVAAIETCVDGYNISSYSTTRKIVVDTVKPTALSVQPAPSSGNKITTGMVTFTVRFSENMDGTEPPVVNLTSAGGQLMKVEMVTFSGDTWTGTAVIPSNNSALYDGTAIISISGGKDLAANTMAEDSTNSVIINTGPAFTTKIFSNPAHEYEIMVVTKSSEALQAPPTCSIQQNSTRTPVVMNFLKERYYAGSYKILADSPGKAYIDMSGSDLNGMTGKDSVEFTVADLSASVRAEMITPSGKATLKAAEGSVSNPVAMYMLARETLESPFAADIKASVLADTVDMEVKNGSELVGVLPLEEIGPANVQLKKCMLYSADVEGIKLSVPAEKVHLYRLGSDGFWRFQGGELKDEKITAQITGLGRLALMADMTAPSIKDFSPADMDKLDDPQPVIEGRLVDYGSGAVNETLKLFIDGVEMPNVKADSKGYFKFKVPVVLPKGRHEIEVEAADKAGNQVRSSFWVTAPGAFAIDQFTPYPNPSTGTHIYFNYNFNQRAERVRLKIYDVAGHRVADFDTFDFANQTDGRIRWDLRNDSGKRVANGVYFYKLQVTRSGKTYKKRGKFAVLR